MQASLNSTTHETEDAKCVIFVIFWLKWSIRQYKAEYMSVPLSCCPTFYFLYLSTHFCYRPQLHKCKLRIFSVHCVF